MAILVIAEHTNQILKPATLNTITAAVQLGKDIDVFVAGNECQSVVDRLSHVSNVKNVLHCDHPSLEHQLAENLAAAIAQVASSYTHILAPANTFGKNVLPRLAALLDVGQVSDVIAIESTTTFKRPIYAGNAIATVEALDEIKVITVRNTAFSPAETSVEQAQTKKIELSQVVSLSRFMSLQESKSERPELTAARVVVSGGRGLQSKENFKIIEELASQLNAAIGASRAAVDAGYVPNDYQVGQTGKVVAPDLYIAVGISGAIQHLAGMKDSKVIVSINKDEDAPIFKISDYWLVGDLFDLVPKLTSQVHQLLNSKA
jgi:electron transfer flavoprotein alpha subunit